MLYRDVRSLFLDFFKRNGHEVMQSSSLIPNDTSLLFTNAGMVQFKDIFLGLDKKSFSSATTSQKCLRISGKHNDLDQVGFTKRHHTFFEMLGNFSFGRYFKEEAICYAWDFLSKELSINPDKLYITVFNEDDVAAKIWKKISGKEVIKISTNDNFWSMGDQGPCGPCSEIFYDHGENYQGNLPGNNVDTGDRYVEIWNLVFMQYNQVKDQRIPLEVPCIDTGMGLERITAVMQGVCDNFEIDIFQDLIADIKNIVNKGNKDASAYKIVADHLRASAFLVSEGVLPSNEGRGYVLRRVIRRAVRYLDKLFPSNEAIFYQLVDGLVEKMGQDYIELKTNQQLIKSTLRVEEEKFKDSLKIGIKILKAELDKKQFVNADIAFKLYDTYGFPLDLTKTIVEEYAGSIDIDGFDVLLNEQRELSKLSWQGSGDVLNKEVFYDLKKTVSETIFTGYEKLEDDSSVTAIISKDSLLESFSDNANFTIVLDKTPFYAESGGQVSDMGVIKGDNFEFLVTDVQKVFNTIFLHHGHLISGTCATGDKVHSLINRDRRNSVMANHTAVHLLHKSLRLKLGDYVCQRGSYVGEEKFHFDFNYGESISPDTLREIEKIVNDVISSHILVKNVVMSKENALEEGATALFEEKYGDNVRVVSVGDFSKELCGGTHVTNVCDIKFFKILSEYSIGSGIRRIEGIAGDYALKYLNNLAQTLKNLASIFVCSIDDVEDKILSFVDRNKELERKCSKYFTDVVVSRMVPKKLQEHMLYYVEMESVTMKEAKNILIQAEIRHKTGLFLLLMKSEDKVTAILAVSKDLTTKYSAKLYIEKIGTILSGKGGGKLDFAQCGGLLYKDINQILEVFE